METFIFAGIGTCSGCGTADVILARVAESADLFCPTCVLNGKHNGTGPNVTVETVEPETCICCGQPIPTDAEPPVIVSHPEYGHGPAHFDCASTFTF